MQASLGSFKENLNIFPGNPLFKLTIKCLQYFQLNISQKYVVCLFWVFYLLWNDSECYATQWLQFVVNCSFSSSSPISSKSLSLQLIITTIGRYDMDTCDHGPGQSLVTSINYDHDTHLSTHGLTKVTSVTIRKLITTTTEDCARVVHVYHFTCHFSTKTRVTMFILCIYVMLYVVTWVCDEHELMWWTVSVPLVPGSPGHHWHRSHSSPGPQHTNATRHQPPTGVNHRHKVKIEIFLWNFTPNFIWSRAIGNHHLSIWIMLMTTSVYCLRWRQCVHRLVVTRQAAPPLHHVMSGKNSNPVTWAEQVSACPGWGRVIIICLASSLHPSFAASPGGLNTGWMWGKYLWILSLVI